MIIRVDYFTHLDLRLQSVRPFITFIEDFFETRSLIEYIVTWNQV